VNAGNRTPVRWSPAAGFSITKSPNVVALSCGRA